MKRKIVIEWEVYDGYVGGSRPQETEIDEDLLGMDWSEYDELTEYEKEEIVNDIIQEQFNEEISWVIKSKEDYKE